MGLQYGGGKLDSITIKPRKLDEEEPKSTPLNKKWVIIFSSIFILIVVNFIQIRQLTQKLSAIGNDLTSLNSDVARVNQDISRGLGMMKGYYDIKESLSELKDYQAPVLKVKADDFAWHQRKTWNIIEKGMIRAEVIGILGKPTSQRNRGGDGIYLLRWLCRKSGRHQWNHSTRGGICNRCSV